MPRQRESLCRTPGCFRELVGPRPSGQRGGRERGAPVEGVDLNPGAGAPEPDQWGDRSGPPRRAVAHRARGGTARA
eukprot:11723304-Alexandrium_andersonii.AAC.1